VTFVSERRPVQHAYVFALRTRGAARCKSPEAGGPSLGAGKRAALEKFLNL
jgi:hypothetical protein